MAPSDANINSQIAPFEKAWWITWRDMFHLRSMRHGHDRRRSTLAAVFLASQSTSSGHAIGWEGFRFRRLVETEPVHGPCSLNWRHRLRISITTQCPDSVGPFIVSVLLVYILFLKLTSNVPTPPPVPFSPDSKREEEANQWSENSTLAFWQRSKVISS